MPRGGATVPEAGRNTTCHRARSGQIEGARCRADLGEAGGSPGASDLWRPLFGPASEDAQGDPGVEPRVAGRGRKSVIPPAFGVRRGLEFRGCRGRLGGAIGAGRARVGPAFGPGGQIACVGRDRIRGRFALQDARAGKAVRAGEALGKRRSTGNSPPARRALPGLRRGGRARASGAGSGVVAAAA
jgi:hypothetical protein